jgi:hypothetical protein
MELFAQKMSTSANNETTVIGTVREEVDKTRKPASSADVSNADPANVSSPLQATEAVPLWILVLMRPWPVRWEVGTVREGDVHLDRVETVSLSASPLTLMLSLLRTRVKGDNQVIRCVNL